LTIGGSLYILLPFSFKQLLFMLPKIAINVDLSIKKTCPNDVNMKSPLYFMPEGIWNSI